MLVLLTFASATHDCFFSSNGMAAGWTDQETKALISAWGEANVQEQLDNVKCNKDIYKKLATELAKQEFHKS